MTEAQRFGNEVLGPDQVKALLHAHKAGASLTNLEIEKTLRTADFALRELRHIFEQEKEAGGV